MLAENYLNLLIICGILGQSAIGSFQEDDSKESSDLLVRNKRVINREPGGDVPVLQRNHAYVVSIKLNREPRHCVGAILLRNLVVTAAKCIVHEAILYKVIAGTAGMTSSYTVHNVTQKAIHLANDESRPTDGIALIVVTPIFTYGVNTHSITLFLHPIRPGTLATISGWGCDVDPQNPGTQYKNKLRAITVSIINYQECVRAYQQFFEITHKDICTHDPNGHKYCGDTDMGAPLVIQEPGHPIKLVGILLWSGSLVVHNRPDIFVNLQHPDYVNWISQQIH